MYIRTSVDYIIGEVSDSTMRVNFVKHSIESFHHVVSSQRDENMELLNLFITLRPPINCKNELAIHSCVDGKAIRLKNVIGIIM